jgi:hypothetical protein
MSSVTPRRNPRRAASQTPSVVSTVQTRRSGPAPASTRRELATRRSNAYGGRGTRMAAPERVVATNVDAGLQELEARRQQSVVSSSSSDAESTASSSARVSTPDSERMATTTGNVSLSYGPTHEAGMVAPAEQPLTSGWLTRQAMNLGGMVQIIPEFLARLFYASLPAAGLLSAVAIGIVVGAFVAQFAASTSLSGPAGFTPSAVAPLDLVKQHMPDLVVLHRNKDTDKLEIPTNLWQAIQAVNRASPREEPLALFTGENEAELRRLVGEEVGEFAGLQFDRVLGEIVTDERIMHGMRQAGLVTKAELVTMVQEQVHQFQAATKSELLSELGPHIHALVRSAQKDLLRQVPESVFDRFVASRALAAAELSLTKVNFFSAALGARVVGRFTSPAVGHHEGRAKRFWSDLFFGRAETAHKAIKVLSPWSEAGQAWCAAPTELGSAAVGIISSHEIYPKSFTIEHAPRDATPDPASAPKWVEVWAEVASAPMRERIDGAAVDPVRRCSGGSDLPDTYRCLARRFYDLDGLSHVQTFELDVDLQAHSRAVGEHQGSDAFVLKVTSNWGGDRTCLYRARMHGETVEGFPMANNPHDS